MTGLPAWAWLAGVMLIGLGSGFLLGTQPSVNGYLSRQLDHPLQASIVSFTTGTLILVILAVAMGVFPPRLQTPVIQMPWWCWGGGAIGALLVTASLIFVPRIGSLPWHATVIAGQLAAALALDHFGWLGNAHQPLSRTRAVGALLLGAGIVIIFWAKKDAVTAGPIAEQPPQAVDTRR